MDDTKMSTSPLIHSCLHPWIIFAYLSLMWHANNIRKDSFVSMENLGLFPEAVVAHFFLLFDSVYSSGKSSLSFGHKRNV